VNMCKHCLQLIW